MEAEMTLQGGWTHVQQSEIDMLSYYPVHQHTAPSAHGAARSESAYGAPEPKGRDKNGVELVSVPVLGPE
jgi:hypothetical protein